MQRHPGHALILALGAAIAGAGCDYITPTLTVKVQAVLPCDQQNALEGVEFMQVKTVDAAGTEQTTQGSRSSGSAEVKGLDISDGTQVFYNGFASAGELEGLPMAVGASVPLQLEANTADQRFPAARNYPRSGNIYVPMGKTNTFASTTDAEASACSVLGQQRHSHTATFSRSLGKVVIIGGLVYASSDGAETFVPRERTVELYDPSTGKFEVASVAANVLPLMQRAHHTATELPDGAILVWGGLGPDGDGTQVSPRAVSFVLNPVDMTVTQLGPSQGFQVKRFNHTATLSENGVSVVMVGGCGCKGALTAAELKRGECPAVGATCDDGQARVAAVDVFDVSSRRITTLTTSVLQKPRAFHTASRLSGGLLVIAGGDDGVAPVREVEIIRMEPSVDFVQSSETLDTSAVTHAAAVVLSSPDCTNVLANHPVGNECVLITGGCLGLVSDGMCAMVQSTATILDFGKLPGTRREVGPALFRARWGHHASSLAAGSNMVLLAGGRMKVETQDANTPVTAEVLPRQASAGGVRPFAPAQVPMMVDARWRSALTEFPSGQLMWTGGEPSVSTATQRTSIGSAELYFFPFSP